MAAPPPVTVHGLPEGATQDTNAVPLRVNTSGQVSLTKMAGEDQTVDVLVTEQRYAYCVDDADIVCKAAAGFVHAISCWPEDAAATDYTRMRLARLSSRTSSMPL